MKKRIRDIPSLKKLSEDVEAIKQVKALTPLLTDGEDTEALQRALSAIDIPSVEKFMTLPERFNAYFVERAWIAYEDLDHRVVVAAVDHADAGDLEAAEHLLIEHYDEARLRYYLKHLKYLRTFKPRMRLLYLALEDYLAGRYHACIPVVLAQLDGAVADLCGRSFFAEGVNLNAWDSISAHDEGLAALAKVLSEKRGKTRDEPISIPHRNGIVHGRDLGYDSQIVAVKAWAALFAVQNLATKIEQGRREPPPEATPLTAEEEQAQQEALRVEKERVFEWQSFASIVGEDIPEEGPPEAYPEGTPEQTVVTFLRAWAKQKYGPMAQCLVERQRTSINETAGQLRSEYESKLLRAFKLVSVTNSTPVGSTIVAACEVTAFEVRGTWEITFQLLYESPGLTHFHGEPGGTWGIILISPKPVPIIE